VQGGPGDRWQDLGSRTWPRDDHGRTPPGILGRLGRRASGRKPRVRPATPVLGSARAGTPVTSIAWVIPLPEANAVNGDGEEEGRNNGKRG